MTISGSWLHHPTWYLVQEKKPRGIFRMVAPSIDTMMEKLKGEVMKNKLKLLIHKQSKMF
jgi:hypothetical protein